MSNVSSTALAVFYVYRFSDDGQKLVWLCHGYDRTVLAACSCCICAAIVKAVDNGEDVNEVEGAGNTPLHNAAYEGWLQGAELLLSLAAKIDASNNAGDRPWHWARNMGQDEMMEMLEQV